MLGTFLWILKWCTGPGETFFLSEGMFENNCWLTALLKSTSEGGND